MKQRFTYLLLSAVLFFATLKAGAQTADPRPPGLYPYVPGTTSATVTKSTWRAEGDQIILDYTLNNPASEAIALHPIFRSKTRPNFQIEPKTMSSNVGASGFNGPGNHLIWQYKRDTPQGLPKDEYYFTFDIASATSDLAAPEGTVLYTALTRTQSFVVACPKAPKEGDEAGLLVIKGAEVPTASGQVMTGDYLMLETGSSAELLNKDGQFRDYWNGRVMNSCVQLSAYLTGQDYQADPHTTGTDGFWRSQLGLWVRRHDKYVFLGRGEGL